MGCTATPQPARVRTLTTTVRVLACADDTSFQTLQSYVQSDLLSSQAYARATGEAPAAGRPTKRDGLPVVPSNSEAKPAAPPSFSPSAFPKEHAYYTTGKAAPATSWSNPAAHLPTDQALEPSRVYAEYYMTPTAAAHFTRPPPTVPGLTPGTAVAHDATDKGSGYGWVHPTSTRFPHEPSAFGTGARARHAWSLSVVGGPLTLRARRSSAVRDAR